MMCEICMYSCHHPIAFLLSLNLVACACARVRQAQLFNKKGERIFSTDDLPEVIEDGLGMIQAGLQQSVLGGMPSKSLDRQKWNDRENGNLPGYPGKNNVILLIPYVRYVTLCTWCRAICIH